MKIIDIYNNLHIKYPNILKIIKKGIFWIILNEEAFFMSKYFNMKITALDKENIKIGFPDQSKSKWLKLLTDKHMGYVLVQKNSILQSENIDIIEVSVGKYYNSIYKLNLEDFLLTKERILGLKKFDLEENSEKNFLLQVKIEELYVLILQLFLKLPKKERFYFRDKVEKIFLDTLEILYKYKYNLGNRKDLIEKIFSNTIILREYFKFLYIISIIKNDNVFLDISEKWLTILKICKGIKNKT